MEELRRKQKLKKRLYSWPALVLLVFITFIFVRGTYLVFQKKIESTRDVQALEAKKNSLDEEQAELTQNIASLKTDAGLEKEVKEKYNVALPGEHVVILVDPDSSSSATSTDGRAWYERLWSDILAAL